MSLDRVCAEHLNPAIQAFVKPRLSLGLSASDRRNGKARQVSFCVARLKAGSRLMATRLVQLIRLSGRINDIDLQKRFSPSWRSTRNRETVQETALSTSDSPVCTSPAFRVSSWGDELK
jgi:hypothetical protein